MHIETAYTSLLGLGLEIAAVSLDYFLSFFWCVYACVGLPVACLCPFPLPLDVFSYLVCVYCNVLKQLV